MSLIAAIKSEIKDIYRYRYVTFSFIQTNLRLRYRRSYLGFIWTVLAPLLNYLVIGLVFSFLMRSQMENFFAYYFSGAVLYAAFASTLNRAPHFLIGNEHFIKKIYLPKLIFVLNGTLYELANFCLSLIALTFLGAFFKQLHLSIYAPLALIPIVMLPLFLVGLGTIISVSTVYFRDLGHIVPVVIQSLFFATPILYPRNMFPPEYQFLIDLNPIYYFLETFRQPLIDGRIPDLKFYYVCFGLSIMSFAAGIILIKKFDNRIVFKL